MKAVKELICCIIYMYGGKSKQASGKAPDGKVRVEAAVEALPRLAGHVLVQVLAVHPQHRCHPPLRLFSETGATYISRSSQKT